MNLNKLVTKWFYLAVATLVMLGQAVMPLSAQATIVVDKSIIVTAPNGGEQWQVGKTHRISWNSTGVQSVVIYLYDDRISGSGAIVNYPVPNNAPIPASQGYYDWTILSNVLQANDGTNFRIIVQDAGNYNVTDKSDAPFSIVSLTTTNKPPVITGMGGPTSLKTNEVGTWSVKAYDPDGTYLSYSVDWGDNTLKSSASRSAITQSATQEATFTHSYSQAGTYYPTFTVTDNTGLSAKTSISVNVEGLTQPSITVLSPNGGETWKVGQKVAIRWQTKGIPQNPQTQLDIMDDRISGWIASSLFGSVPALDYATLISSNGDENIYEYSFIVPQNFNSSLPSQYQNVYGGNHYTVNVTIVLSGQAGTPSQRTKNDSSDAPFSIVSSVSLTNKPPVITAVGGPTTLQVNETGTWVVKAYDPDGTYLSYGVDWGEGSVFESRSKSLAPTPSATQEATLSYTYGSAGKYHIVFTVSDQSGGSTKSSLTIVVGVGGEQNSPPDLVASLDPTSPPSGKVQVGQTVVFSKIVLAPNESVILNGIQVGTDTPDADKILHNIKIYDGNYQVGAAVTNLTWNGEYYYAWFYPKPSLYIGSVTKRSLTIQADVASGATGNIRLGVWGLNFDYPGATVTGLPITGNTMMVSTTSPFPIPPLTETTIQAEQTLQKRIQKLEYRVSELESQLVEAEKKLVQQIDNSLINRVAGKILLQVEGKGEAWYVDKDTRKKFYLKDGDTAYTALQAFGLGITNNDLAKIPVVTDNQVAVVDSDNDGLDDKLEESIGTDANKSDTDGDGYPDSWELANGFSPLGTGRLTFDAGFSDRLNGKILLQVQGRGQAWYVLAGKRYYLKDGPSAYQIMRSKSLGVTNNDLRKINVGEFE